MTNTSDTDFRTFPKPAIPLPSKFARPKLHAWLAQIGIASRRAAENLIQEGRVRVNGVPETNVAARIDPKHAQVEVDGEKVSALSKEENECWLVFKPAGYVSTAKDPEGRKTVLRLVPSTARLYPVGRLDLDSEGLLLLTNDGDLAYRLTHPKFQVPKVYEVEVRPMPSPPSLRRLRMGVPLKDGVTAPAEVRVLEKKGSVATLQFTLREGRHRQVRRMCEAVNVEVLHLRRVSFGTLSLGEMKPGQSHRVTTEELEKLMA